MSVRWDHRQSIKEFVRHAALKSGLVWAVDRYTRSRGFPRSHLEPPTPDGRFRAIYQSGTWVYHSEQKTLSGVGSEEIATENVRVSLPELLLQLNCDRLLDIGCGDWNWMQHVILPCAYIGLDIVPELIAANRRFERNGVTFEVADAITGPLPDADVVLCREVLFHLSFDDGRAALENIRRAASWFIATTDTAIWYNSDIRSGDFRRVNLERSPYRLPPPREIIVDDAVAGGRVLGLWPTEALRSNE